MKLRGCPVDCSLSLDLCCPLHGITLFINLEEHGDRRLYVQILTEILFLLVFVHYFKSLLLLKHIGYMSFIYIYNIYKYIDRKIDRYRYR